MRGLYLRALSEVRDCPGMGCTTALLEMILAVLLALCVPKTSSTSCDQAIFVNQANGTSLFWDAVLVEIDRFG